MVSGAYVAEYGQSEQIDKAMAKVQVKILIILIPITLEVTSALFNMQGF